MQRCKITTYDDKISTWVDTHLQLDPRFIFTIRSIPSELRTPFCLTQFLETLSFDHALHTSDRYTAYYGTQAYSYGGISHHPKPFTDNSMLTGLINIIHQLFPGIHVNSALVNYYPTPSSCINFHADDEDSIEPNSYIFSITFGGPRALLFRHKYRVNNNICSVTPNEWDILIFSRNSQNNFKHGILAADDSTFFNSKENLKSRLSITFRTLKTE